MTESGLERGPTIERVPGSRRISEEGIVAGESDRYSRIYAVVRRIPRGRVATYGQVAQLAGLSGHARQVGTRFTQWRPITLCRGIGSSTRAVRSARAPSPARISFSVSC